MRLEPRDHVSMAMAVAGPVLAVLAAMAICSLLILWSGSSVSDAYALLFKGALGSRFAISETLTRTTVLTLTGLAAAVAFRAKLWNIGGEGQLYVGACAATMLGTGQLQWPPYLLIPTLFLAGALAGGLLLLVPTLLKTHLKVDEVVTTLLLNFIILLLVNYLVFGPWKDPMAMGWPQAAAIIDEGLLPKLLAKTRLHAGFLVALASAVGAWVLMRFTVWGYEIRAVGANPEAARFAGVPVNRTIVRTALISGGLAGMAGVCELIGLKGYLTLDLSPGFGYTGIVVAMLAGLHPLGVILSAFFVAVVFNGADSMSRALSVSNYIAEVITAVSLLTVLVSMLLTRYKLKWK
ncbi:MAG: ABC transporter permease [Desulfuromonadales bacterium]|nr:ABC transporter permease [Desulfuromonadales bacterium]